MNYCVPNYDCMLSKKFLKFIFKTKVMMANGCRNVL